MKALKLGNLPIPETEKGKGTKEKVEKTLTEEIVIAICSPIGALKEPVIDALIERLKQYGYEHQVLKLSSYISKYDKEEYINHNGKTDIYNTIKNKIDGGNRLRTEYSNSILAEIAISEIYIDRIDAFINFDELPPVTAIKTRRKCYIIDSIKNPEELHILRSVYREIFYFISIYSPLHERKENLLNKNLSKSEIEQIINNDNFENDSSGQRVRDVFIEADFFVRASNNSLVDISKKVERYLHLIFDSEIITPSSGEIAMYQAKSAAGNSACMSRQVGAAITDQNGSIISIGWNDVPKYGGNLYRDGDFPDNRCKVIGHCHNDSTKDELTDDIISKLLNDQLLKTSLFKFENSDPDPEAVEHLKALIRKSTKLKDLIEFSRSVHAEMHAIIVGSQLSGSRMVNGKLFCTTYPCHNCARHIIAAGIKEIFYIEPYVKSLCIQLHSDAITENELEEDKVKILVYDGVAPRRFLEFFSMSNARKDSSGQKKSLSLSVAYPKSRLTLQALPTLEAQAIHSLTELGILKTTP
jgi:deoxycytidylate deaminase